ncbi:MULTISPECIES: hypothetical protein [Weissella]|jgi:hypothetical protein|uniref:Uncharacterized protein n=1 Tax=Weissella confusa TaxID=1583 RepID=A0AAJ3DC79_WEICO|nr:MULTISPECIES: hypothetical protein [Weissella]NBA12193.1 hypothetical protein [Weissella confusa]
MATYKPLGRYDLKLNDRDFKNMTQKLNGNISKARKTELHRLGDKLKSAYGKYEIEIR